MDNKKLTKLKELLLLALESEGAEMGILRNYDPSEDKLTIVSHHGFQQEYISHFYSVKPFDHSSCGRAFGVGTTIIIHDIEHDLSFKKQGKCIKSLNAEFRAVKSAPLLNSKGKKLGVLTSHFKKPKWDLCPNCADKILLEIADILN